MALRDKIFPGDTYVVSIEARKTDPDNPHDSRGVPADVDEATVKVLDSLTGTFVHIGGPSITEVGADIVPASGDTGAIISYVLPAAFTQTPGSCRIFIRATYTDTISGEEIKLTEDRTLQVNEYR